MKKFWVILLIPAILLAVVFATAFSPLAQSSIEITPEIPPEPEPTAIPPVKEDLQTVYRLTIYYIYEDGTEAAGTFTSQIDVGAPYDVLSPIIEGFSASEDEIKGTMPARDIEFTVVYIGGVIGIVPGTILITAGGDEDDSETQVVRLFTIEDYETSLGLGASMMNVGICVE